MVDQKEEDKKDRKRKQSQIEKSGRMMNEDNFVYRDDTMKETLTEIEEKTLFLEWSSHTSNWMFTRLTIYTS